MKRLIQGALAAIGAHVSEPEPNELKVSFPKPVDLGSPFGRLDGRILSFNSSPILSDAEKVSNGSKVMDDIASALSNKGASRHWRVPVGISTSRKSLGGKIEFWKGDVLRFSTRKKYQTSLVCFFKIGFSNYDLLEEVIGIEIGAAGPPRIITDIPTPPPDWELVGRPIIKRSELEKMAETAFEKAKSIAMERSESFRHNVVEALYKTVQQLKRYYEQMKTEALTTADEAEKHDIEEEYRFRKREEMEKATVRVVIELIALETISSPVAWMTYEVISGNSIRSVTSVVSLTDGEVLNAVQCEACRMEGTTIGLTEAGKLVCPSCHSICHSCGMDVIVPNAQKNAACSSCGKTFCEKHSLICDSCKRLVCTEHAVTCTAGCHICESCATTCVECGRHVVWCRDHVFTNQRHEAVCKDHVLYCSGCKEPYSSKSLQNCASCGQLVCSGCSEVCVNCGERFCLNHIHNRRCVKCEIPMDGKKREMALRILNNLEKEKFARK